MIMFNEMKNNQSKVVYDDTKGEPLNNDFAKVLSTYFHKEDDKKEDIEKEIEENKAIEDSIDDIGKRMEEEAKSNPKFLSIYDMCKTLEDEVLEELAQEEKQNHIDVKEIADEEDEIVHFDDEEMCDEEEDIYVPEEKQESYLDKLVFIDKEKWELTAMERWWLKKHPEKYRLGVDPRVEERRRRGKREKKARKKKEKIKNMTPEERQEFLEERELRKRIKEYNKGLEQFNAVHDKKKRKKAIRMQEKINKAYRKQMADNSKDKYKNIVDYTYKKEFKEYKNSIGFKTKDRFDPYSRYRKHGNIITVAEAEAYEKDFRSSFMKNLEEELMQKLNEPITLGGHTVVEYYDKKGRLKSKELLEGGKPKTKKQKKKHKKNKEKYKNSVLSPNYKDL